MGKVIHNPIDVLQHLECGYLLHEPLDRYSKFCEMSFFNKFDNSRTNTELVDVNIWYVLHEFTIDPMFRSQLPEVPNLDLMHVKRPDEDSFWCLSHTLWHLEVARWQSTPEGLYAELIERIFETLSGTDCDG